MSRRLAFPRRRRGDSVRLLHEGDPTTARVSLSFDNGPDPERTPRILDVLARLGVRASFFVVGQQLAKPGARQIAERALAEGHWIGNHTYSHAVPLGQDTGPEAVAREIVQTQELMGPLVHSARWFRPFGAGGQLDARLLSRAAVERLVMDHYSCVLWNCVPRDWEDPAGWPEVALAAVESQPFSLVVVHDFVEGNDRHAAHFIERCRDAGHTLVQEYPPECVPIDRGEVRLSLDDWVS